MTPWPDCAHCRFPPDRGALTAAPMTAAPATGPPPSSSSTSQSKLSPTRAARIGQREFPAAFGHFMSGSPHRQQACCWRHPPEFAWIISSPSPLCPVPMPPPLGSVDSGLSWLSKCRAILVRYDKKASNYVGLIQLACALLWYRRQHRLLF